MHRLARIIAARTHIIMDEDEDLDYFLKHQSTGLVCLGRSYLRLLRICDDKSDVNHTVELQTSVRHVCFYCVH